MHLPAYCICRRFQQKFYIFLQFLRLSNTIEISLARIFIFKGYLRFHLVTDKKKKDERRECYGIKNGGQKNFRSFQVERLERINFYYTRLDFSTNLTDDEEKTLLVSEYSAKLQIANKKWRPG